MTFEKFCLLVPINTSPVVIPVMGKRHAEEDADDHERCKKRRRPNTLDRLSLLSDELLLRILSFLSVSELVLCQRCEP